MKNWEFLSRHDQLCVSRQCPHMSLSPTFDGAIASQGVCSFLLQFSSQKRFIFNPVADEV